MGYGNSEDILCELCWTVWYNHINTKCNNSPLFPNFLFILRIRYQLVPSCGSDYFRFCKQKSIQCWGISVLHVYFSGHFGWLQISRVVLFMNEVHEKILIFIIMMVLADLYYKTVLSGSWFVIWFNYSNSFNQRSFMYIYVHFTSQS